MKDLNIIQCFDGEKKASKHQLSSQIATGCVLKLSETRIVIFIVIVISWKQRYEEQVVSCKHSMPKVMINDI